MAVAVLSATIYPAALAASATQKIPAAPKGITISPAFQQVSIPAGQEQMPISFSITNNKSRAQTLELSAADFNTLDESGGLFFVGTNPTQLEQKYGLAKWLSLPSSSLTIQPKQTAVVKAKILNLPTLAPGGHYGALNIAAAGNTTEAGKIALHPIASSLLFVTKLGGDTHIMKLTNVSDKHTLFSLPSSVSLRFRNDGNTHVISRGYITIADPRGKIVSQGTVNEDSDILLPQKFRDFVVPIQRTAAANFAGRYKLTLNYRFDGFNNFRTFQTGFYVLSGWSLVLLIVIILMGIAAAYTFLKKPTWFKKLLKFRRRG